MPVRARPFCMQAPDKKGGIAIGPQEGASSKEGKQGKGWDVLKDDFAGLQGILTPPPPTPHLPYV